MLHRIDWNESLSLSLRDVAGALLWSHPPTTPTQLNNWRWAIRLWCEFQSLQFCNKQFSFDVINECHQKKIKVPILRQAHALIRVSEWVQQKKSRLQLYNKQFSSHVMNECNRRKKKGATLLQLCNQLCNKQNDLMWFPSRVQQKTNTSCN